MLELAPADALEARLLRLTDDDWRRYAVNSGLIDEDAVGADGFELTGDPAIDAWMRERAELRASDG